MARKQIRCTQIPCIALFTVILVAFSTPLWAQRGSTRRVPELVSAAEVERDIGRRQASLDSIKAELDRGRVRFRALQNQEGNYLSRLEQLERNIAASGRYMDLVQRQIDTTEIILIQLGDSLTKAEADLEQARERMMRRLRNAYMTGEADNKLQMLLSAKNPTEVIHRARAFRDLNQYDRRLAETIRDGIATVNNRRAAQEANRQALVTLFEGRRHEQQALITEEASRRTVLEDVRSKREASAAMVAELEEAQRELDAVIRMLEARRTRLRVEEERAAAIDFENRKGKLAWPVEGRITSKYGMVVHPVYKTVIMNDGIDITAPKGTSVKSVAPGTVGMISRMRGLGLCVFIIHSGGYFTLYAHLDEVTVADGQDVSSEMIIGKVGESGTAGGPKLHFRIRTAESSFDPEEWLVSR